MNSPETESCWPFVLTRIGPDVSCEADMNGLLCAELAPLGARRVNAWVVGALDGRYAARVSVDVETPLAQEADQRDAGGLGQLDR